MRVYSPGHNREHFTSGGPRKAGDDHHKDHVVTSLETRSMSLCLSHTFVVPGVIVQSLKPGIYVLDQT